MRPVQVYAAVVAAPNEVRVLDSGGRARATLLRSRVTGFEVVSQVPPLSRRESRWRWRRQRFGPPRLSSLVSFVVQQSHEFSFYPLSIYDWTVQLMFTVLVPYLVGVAVSSLAYTVWSRGLRRYNSAGA